MLRVDFALHLFLSVSVYLHSRLVHNLTFGNKLSFTLSASAFPSVCIWRCARQFFFFFFKFIWKCKIMKNAHQELNKLHSYTYQSASITKEFAFGQFFFLYFGADVPIEPFNQNKIDIGGTAIKKLFCRRWVENFQFSSRLLDVYIVMHGPKTIAGGC